MGKDQELLEAARNGNVPVVEKILSQRAKRSGPLASLRRGPGANVQDSSGYSALHHAALNGHRDIVELLLTHEASTNIVDVKGSSPLHLAAWTGNEDIVRLLLCHGPSVPNVNLTNKDRETSMHCAAQYGHTAVVSLLLEHSCDPTIRNNREETALDLAAQYGRLETVELLVRTHPELIHPYARGSSGNVFPHTPLHLASRNGHKAVVSVLLNAGFDVNVRTAAGTALHEAALCGKVEVVRSLLEGGVDLQAQDQYHKTVMDVLGQFQTHVTQEITAIIKKHRAMLGSPNDTEDKENANPLPPIPIPSLGSPYENVRLTPKGGRVMESPTTSPTHWEFYDVPPKGREGGDDRRISGTSAMSVGSDNLYQTPPAPKSLESSFLSEELSDLSSRHSSLYQAPRDRDLDQMSISSNSSTGPSPSPRDRFLIDSHRGSRELLDGDRRSGGQGHDNYLPMAPGTGVKVSPTPPKKPPRRNLSVSPTHLQPHELLDGPTGAYEYLFLARSGHRSQDLEDASIRPSMIRDRELMMRRGRSADHPDQYVDMKMRQSMLGTYENFEQAMEFLKKANRKSDGTGDEGEHERRPAYENVDRSFNILVPPTEITFRNYQRRKLRRHNDNAYENYEPRQLKSGSVESAGDRVEAAVDGTTATFVSSAYIRLKSSEESLLDEKRPASTPDADKPSSILSSSAGGEVPTKKKKKVVLPLSPTHYKQPPTPDHPPPSAIQAEKSIHDRIRPLSQEYKRRSRDIETETEEDFFPSLDASSGSLSSSVSLSDKSVSTDNVEEFLGDVPFAGLFKGSTTPAPDGTGRSAERPKTLRRLKNVYENVGQEAANEDLDDGAGGKRSSRGSDKTQSLSILSPFDEQEEWAKISEIMASFGTGLVRESVFVNELEKEFQNRLGLSRSDSGSSPSSLAGSSVGQWLASLGLVEYESNFINNGFDDIDFIFGVLEENDLKEMGISNLKHCSIILEAVKNLPSKLQRFGSNGVRVPETVDDWLRAIHLDCYVDIFHKHLYTDMDRILRIWEVEVTTVLEINKLGHRKRILASVGDTRRGSPGPNLDEINADLKQLKSSINQLKEEIKEKLPTDNPSKSPVVSGTGTLRHSHKKGRPPPPPPGTATPVKTANGSEDLSIRDPSELLVGVPATLTTQWRHQPQVLVNGSVTYVASYLGSTLVKELRGTESTKKSIQKLKKSPKESKRTPDVILSVSYRGVKFLNATNKDIICEHEIRNIHCACQDADDLTHFAYITKDHLTKDHYCHVFCVHTMDQATEVILTLGQAFEVAYQMALREQFSHNRGHIRSQSANQIVQKGPNGNHARSQSVNEIKVNGSQALPQNSNIEKHTPTSEKNDISLSLKREQVGSETSSVKSDSESSNLQSSIGRAPIVFTEEM